MILLTIGCQAKRPQEPEPTAPPAPTLSAVSGPAEHLLFRYRDAEGGFASATTIDEIPAGSRAAVQVIDLSKSPAERHAAQTVQVFDLRQKEPDGRYSGHFIKRADLEGVLAEAAAEKKAAQPQVTMYSAAWCGVCKKARRFLTQEGIPFVEKDIEKDTSAAAELRNKAQQAGVSANGVPVFDVGGRIFSGFDPQTLKRAARGG
jgi:glutaredoxin